MRLIDADRLLTERMMSLYYHLPNGDIAIPIIDIKHSKTIDAVEVVRCKDCKHWVKDGNDSYGYAMSCKANCSLGGQGIKKPDDFCSYAERRTDEQTKD